LLKILLLCILYDADRVLFVIYFLGICDDLRLAVWLSGNALASIKVVALRQTRLVPGWVTICVRVNHLVSPENCGKKLQKLRIFSPKNCNKL